MATMRIPVIVGAFAAVALATVGVWWLASSGVDNTPMLTLTASDLRKELPFLPMSSAQIAAGFKRDLVFADATYNCPTSAWVSLTLEPRFKTIADGFHLETWATTNDCDKFAELYHIVAHMHHAQSPQPNKAEGIAVGFMFYCIHGDLSQRHAINIIAIDAKHVIFEEPQTCATVTLSPEELSSVFFCYF